MTPAERQTRLALELLRFEDPQERLSYVQDRVRRRPPFPDALRVEEHRIHGCMTKVWLNAEFRNGRCHFEVDAESAMVRGLASLIAESFCEALPLEILEFKSSILEESRLATRITPTRQQGLLALEAAIREFAKHCPLPA